jgi:hypothetical protein
MPTMDVLVTKKGYQEDPWCQRLEDLMNSLPGLWKDEKGLYYISECLVIMQVDNLHEHLFHTAHDVAGHFDADKSYTLLRGSYY